jgi:hypothetical protein
MEPMFLVATLLTSTLVTAGLLALWASTNSGHWFLRTAAFLAAIGPLLLIPAYEPFIVLTLEGATIAAGIKLARRKPLFRRSRKRAGASPPPAAAASGPTSIPTPESTAHVAAANPRAARPPRFRIATMLLAMALLGIAAAIAARMPEIYRQGWQSMLAVGVGAGLAVLLGSYAATRRGWWKLPATIAACLLAVVLGVVLANVDWFDQMLHGGTWPPNPDVISFGLTDDGPAADWLLVLPAVVLVTAALVWLVAIAAAAGARPRRRGLAGAAAVAVVALVVTPAAFVLWQMLTPESVPAVVLPQPNAFDEFVAAGQSIEHALVNSANFDQATAPRPQIVQAVTETAAAVDRARRAFEFDCLVPVDYTSDSTLLAGVQSARSLARGFSVAARLAELDGDFDAALASLLDAVSLGIESRRGGLIVDGMVGCAITNIGTHGINDFVDQLSPKQCRQTIERLRQLEGACEPYDGFERRDRIWTQHQGWASRLQQTIDDIGEVEVNTIGESFFPQGYDGPFRSESIKFRMLCARLALRAYEVEHGVLPANWDEVESAGLPALGVDPWDATGARLRYRRTEQGFVLYSVGQNGVDDGGAAPSEYADPTMAGMGDPATGDLLSDEVF